MKKICLALAWACITFTTYGQQVRPANSARIYHELGQLRHLTSVLYVAAHPDDENTRLLAWLVNEQNIRTAYLSLTRGDGGQNILGKEQGEALGLIRTHELMEARKIDGAEQFFSRAIDFGFSKTYEETFRHWAQSILVNDAVWVIRKFRPDVVICRFPPDTRAGHGQHAASAIIAARAFKAAGDRTLYAGQLASYPAWQPKRLMWNTYKFGDRNTTSEDQLKLKVGEYLPGFGEGCGELAGRSRSVHKSQGAGTPSVPGVQTEYFKMVDGDSASKSLFDGIDITWGRVGRPDIGEDLEKIIDHFEFKHPDASLPALLAVRSKINEVADIYWRTEKLEEIDQVILDCAGFMTELYAKQPQAVRGAELPFTLHVIARSHTPVSLTSIQWSNGDSATNLRLPVDTMLTFEHTIGIPDDAYYTQPYWLQYPHMPGADMYSVTVDSLLGLPETPPQLVGTLRLNIGGAYINVHVPLSYKKLDPLKGDIVEQLRIVPPVTVDFGDNVLLAARDGSVRADVRLHTFKELKHMTLNVTGRVASVQIRDIDMQANADTVISVTIPAGEAAKEGSDEYELRASVTAEATPQNLSLHLIQYSHLPTLQYFTHPAAKVVKPDWKCTAKRIGYIEGAGDFIPAFLRQAGLEVDVLKEKDMTSAANLKKYDAIITGIRAVNVEKRMAYWLPVLLQYAANGGTLVLQYNTLQDMSTTKLGPYPFQLSSDRVTEENARVDFTDTTSRLLRYPNKITAADFKGWVQERGLYFPSKWDEHYKTLFSMHDEGEQPLTGSTIYTKTGKGWYVYTSLSFFRQLPAGNKGAIRLLMNILSVGK